MKGAGLSKNERLVSQKLINELFLSGQSKSLTAFPLRAVYMQLPTRGCAKGGFVGTQILISVPKKRLKHAVDRNRVKRQLREAYRRNKQLLHDGLPQDYRLLVAFIWLSDELSPTSEVEERMVRLLKKIAAKGVKKFEV